jgi:hypothetical protein
VDFNQCSRKLPCEQCSLKGRICSLRPKAVCRQSKAVTQPPPTTGRDAPSPQRISADREAGKVGPIRPGSHSNNSLVRHCESLSNSCHAGEVTSTASTGVGYTLPTSSPASITLEDQQGGTIHYGCDDSPPAIRSEAGIEHVPDTGVSASTFISTGQSSGWPAQVAWGSMLAIASDLRVTLPPFDWLDWSQDERPTQSDAGDILHPAGLAQGPELLSFQSQTETPRYPGNSGDMAFWDEWPQGTSSATAIGGNFGPEEQGEPSCPPLLTGLHNMSEPESQDFAFERPFEGPVSPLPTELCLTPNWIELDSMTTLHELVALSDTCSGNVECQQLSPWLKRLMEYCNDTLASRRDLPIPSEQSASSIELPTL